jgi:hypothetical protein
MRGIVCATLLAVATLMPEVASAQTEATPQSGVGHGPANICQELIAFLRQIDPAVPQSGASAAAPAQQTAVAAPQQGPGGLAAPAHPSGHDTQGREAGEQRAVTTQPSGQGAPTSSGLSGPTPSTSAQGAPAPQATGQGSAVAQVQPQPGQGLRAAPRSERPSPTAVAEAEALARDNNIAGCRGAVQEMRRAGVALPAPLIALAGLELK